MGILFILDWHFQFQSQVVNDLICMSITWTCREAFIDRRREIRGIQPVPH
jgi:hypothetical protein